MIGNVTYIAAISGMSFLLTSLNVEDGVGKFNFSLFIRRLVKLRVHCPNVYYCTNFGEKVLFSRNAAKTNT